MPSKTSDRGRGLHNGIDERVLRMSTKSTMHAAQDTGIAVITRAVRRTLDREAQHGPVIRIDPITFARYSKWPREAIK